MSYYADNLAANRLRRCYELATPAVNRYLDDEIDFLRQHLNPKDRVLELGCGYGRIMRQVAADCELIVGIDTAPSNLRLGASYLADRDNCRLAIMNAINLALADATFDCVFCLQNGISAFHVDQAALITEALRVVRPGGKVLFSTYAAAFWSARLEWFRIQAAQGLIGEIDETATGQGTIVCKDGFTATTVDAAGFAKLTCNLTSEIEITEIRDSSLFCVITRRP
ncbi:MAG: class I SAM-dependent methyltransferase [bacterium]|nr:class I SAM-dependent methyltransferase [bacterium]